MQTANEQSRFLVEELGKKLRSKGNSHLFGDHLYHCHRQCGFNDHTSCVSSHCKEQSGETHYGRYSVTNLAAGPDAASNPQSGTSAMSACEIQGVNWTLETLYRLSGKFLAKSVHRSPQRFPIDPRTSVVSLLSFCCLPLLAKLIHQYIKRCVFEIFQESMDFKQ